MRKRSPEVVGKVSHGGSSGGVGGHHSVIFQGQKKDIVKRGSGQLETDA